MSMGRTIMAAALAVILWGCGVLLGASLREPAREPDTWGNVDLSAMEPRTLGQERMQGIAATLDPNPDTDAQVLRLVREQGSPGYLWPYAQGMVARGLLQVERRWRWTVAP